MAAKRHFYKFYTGDRLITIHSGPWQGSRFVVEYEDGEREEVDVSNITDENGFPAPLEDVWDVTLHPN